MAQRHSALRLCALLAAPQAIALLPAVAASRPLQAPAPIPAQPPQRGPGDAVPDARIEFDSRGVDFGPWLRRFIAQVRRNWKAQGLALQDKGHAAVTFKVHRDGTITEAKVKQRSGSVSIDQAALGAVKSSSPAPPLPPGFPKDACPFQITLYCNEAAPSPVRRP
jgi:TonB family protein